MPSQRHLIGMTGAEADAFLHERRTMSVATVGRDGAVHLVAMWFGFLDGAPAFVTFTKSQKIQNLRRDPRLTALVEDGEAYGELRGLELVGRGMVLDDPEVVLRAARSVVERYVVERNAAERSVVERYVVERNAAERNAAERNAAERNAAVQEPAAVEDAARRMAAKRSAVRIEVERTVSWDHRKLQGGAG